MRKNKNLSTKFRKLQKISVKSNQFDYKRIALIYGVYGLQALEAIRLKDIQIDSLKKTIKKIIKKAGRVWILIKADQAITQKPQQVRMGKGKGNYSYSVAVVKIGTILVELGGSQLTKKLALKALKIAAHKLPIKTEICIYKI